MNEIVRSIGSGTGAIAVEVAGEGPLVVCVPGIGDLRSAFRHFVPDLVAAGFRVAVLDLRGHGDSSLGFDRYDDEAVAGDVLAVIEALGGGPAAVVGNSLGAAAAVLAAARAPETVTRIVLIGPFVRDAGSQAMRLAFRLSLLKPWGPAVWRWYFARLFPTGGPDDLAEHRAAVSAALARPGRWRAFRRLAGSSHAPAEAALPSVRAETLVVMGERDPDFPDPSAEASWVAGRLRGTAVVIPEAGHYPMAERAGLVLAAVLPFLRQAGPRG